MVEIDPYFFYWVSRTAHEMITGLNLQPPSLVCLASGRDAFRRFAGAHKDDFLPKSKSKAKEIADKLDQLLPTLGNTIEVGDIQFQYFYSLLTDFEEQLQEECKHLYVLCVEDQRLMSSYVLIERIEKAVSPKTWNFMAKLARREMEESGKCLAVERYTASGFHILRCVEVVIREYIVAATGSTPKQRDWFTYIDTLKKNGADDGVTSTLDNIRISDRNPLMHPEDFLDKDAAIGLFSICQTALDRLISDMEKRGFAKVFIP